MGSSPLTLEERLSKVDQAISASIELGIKRALEFVGISFTQFYKVISAYPDRHASYCRAKECRVDLLVDETIAIADTEANPFKARVRVEARQWLASKITPRVYGDRLDLNVTQTVDIRSALQSAKDRARIRTVENSQLAAPQSIDIQSDASSEFDKLLK
jgi:hypothetical protein